MLKATPSLFSSKSKTIRQLFNALIQVQPETPLALLTSKAPSAPQKISGVYVFSDPTSAPETVMYVGQSNDVMTRLAEHCAITGRDRANFAYMLTVRTTGFSPQPYTPTNTKAKLFDDPRFAAGFDQSIDRIRNLNYRYLQVTDCLTKNLLEIYASVVLESEFNDFG